MVGIFSYHCRGVHSTLHIVWYIKDYMVCSYHQVSAKVS